MHHKNKQKNVLCLLDSGDEVSLIPAKVYNSLKEKPKLKTQTAVLQSVKDDSIDIDECDSSKYELGRRKQQHKFFVVPERIETLYWVENG